MRGDENRYECDDEDNCEGSGGEPEDRLVDAVFNAMSTSTTPSTTTAKEETTTRTTTPVERTTKSSFVLPSDGASSVTSDTPASTPKPEPARGGSFKSTQTLLAAALIAVLFGSVLTTKISLC